MRPKLWVAVKINCILSAKSKNARMGAGVGAWVRAVFLPPVYFFVLEFEHYSPMYIKQVCRYLNFKTQLCLALKI